ncbi:unnamed protein product, partial [Ilex paraguariensis]
NFIDLVLGPTSGGTPKPDTSAVVRPSAVRTEPSPSFQNKSHVTTVSKHRALSPELEDDSDLVEDSTSIIKLVRGQSVEKKRKVIVEPFADDLRGA